MQWKSNDAVLPSSGRETESQDGTEGLELPTQGQCCSPPPTKLWGEKEAFPFPGSLRSPGKGWVGSLSSIRDRSGGGTPPTTALTGSNSEPLEKGAGDGMGGEGACHPPGGAPEQPCDTPRTHTHSSDSRQGNGRGCRTFQTGRK